MKNLIPLILFLSTTTLFAQSSTFEYTIEQNLRQITTNTDFETWTSLSQSFGNITANHPNEWLSNYYTAYAYMKLAGTYEDQTLPIVAEHLDKAQIAIDKANTLSPNNAEVLTLQGFIYIARIWESPYMNGGIYGRKISKIYKEVLTIDAENPRAHYLKGLLTFHTPRFVGGGKEKAKPYLESAMAKFDAFSFESAISPFWGAEETERLYLECGGIVSATK